LINELYIYKKEIDWSVLHYGINIPVSIQYDFYENIKTSLKKGDTMNIALIIENKEYTAKLINIYFDQKKYPDHKDLLQIRYTPNSETAKEIRKIFYKSFDYLKVEKAKLDNSKKQLKTPENLREYLAIYSTPFNDKFLIDCITTEEKQNAIEMITDFTEEEFEFDLNYNRIDEKATIIQKQKLVKIRKLDKSICESLKINYQFKCQICGNDFGKHYDAKIIEAHHIIPFTVSMNNNPENILIICPNHHRIIHKAKPIFDYKNFSYLYPNGLTENLKLNKHLF
jgi:5-methylcytosine-specific restriction protein A